MAVLKRYVMSNANLVGCGAAGVVLLLYLVGVIDQYWWALTVVGYGAGAAAAWPAPAATMPAGLETRDALDWLRTQVSPKLPQGPATALKHILDIAEEMWPRLKEMEKQGMIQIQNRALLKNTLTQLLPSMVTTYLNLPPLYATTHKVDGKTPVQLLTEQLTVIENHVKDIRDGIYSTDIDALLANSRYLQEQFQSRDEPR